MDEVKVLNESFKRNRPNNGNESSKRFKFMKKSIKIDNLTNSFSIKVLSRFQLEKLESLDTTVCLFSETLLELKDKDISPQFRDLYDELKPLTPNLASVVHHLDEIVELLNGYLRLPIESSKEYSKSLNNFDISTTINLESPLLLLNVLSRELGELLFSSISVIFKTLVELMAINYTNLVAVDKIFNSLNAIFIDQAVILSKQKPDFLINLFCPLIFAGKDFIRKKTGDLLATIFMSFPITTIVTVLLEQSSKDNYKKSVAQLLSCHLVDIGMTLHTKAIETLNDIFGCVDDFDILIDTFMFSIPRIQECERIKLVTTLDGRLKTHHEVLHQVVERLFVGFPKVLSEAFCSIILEFAFDLKNCKLFQLLQTWKYLFFSMAMKKCKEMLLKLEDAVLEMIAKVLKLKTSRGNMFETVFQISVEQIAVLNGVKLSRSFKRGLIELMIQKKVRKSFIAQFTALFELYVDGFEYNLNKKQYLGTFNEDHAFHLVVSFLSQNVESINKYISSLKDSQCVKAFAFVLQCLHKYSESKLHISLPNISIIEDLFIQHSHYPVVAMNFVRVAEVYYSDLKKKDQIFDICVNNTLNRSSIARKSSLIILRKLNFIERIEVEMLDFFVMLESIPLDVQHEREKKRLLSKLCVKLQTLAALNEPKKQETTFTVVLNVLCSHFFEPFKPLWAVTRETIVNLFKLEINKALKQHLAELLFSFTRKLHENSAEFAVNTIELPVQYNFDNSTERTNSIVDAFIQLLKVYKSLTLKGQSKHLYDLFVEFIKFQYFTSEKACTCVQLATLLAPITSSKLYNDNIDRSIKFLKVEAWLEHYSTIKVPKGVPTTDRLVMKLISLYFLEHGYNFNTELKAMKTFLQYQHNELITEEIKDLLLSLPHKNTAKFNESATKLRPIIINMKIQMSSSIKASIVKAVKSFLSDDKERNQVTFYQVILSDIRLELCFLVHSAIVGRLAQVSKLNYDKILVYFDMFDESFFSLFVFKQVEIFKSPIGGKLNMSRYITSLRLATILNKKYKQKYVSYHKLLIRILIPSMSVLSGSQPIEQVFSILATNGTTNHVHELAQVVCQLSSGIIRANSVVNVLNELNFHISVREVIVNSYDRTISLLQAYRKTNIHKVPYLFNLLDTILSRVSIFTLIFSTESSQVNMFRFLLKTIENNYVLTSTDKALEIITQFAKIQPTLLTAKEGELSLELIKVLLSSHYKLPRLINLLEFLLLNCDQLKFDGTVEKLVKYLLVQIQKCVVDSNARQSPNFQAYEGNFNREKTLFNCLKHVMKVSTLSKELKFAIFQAATKYLNKFNTGNNKKVLKGIDRFIVTFRQTMLDYWIKSEAQTVLNMLFKDVCNNTELQTCITEIFTDLNSFSKKHINEINIDVRLDGYSKLKTLLQKIFVNCSEQNTYVTELNLLLNGCIVDLFSADYSLRSICYETVLFIQESVLKLKIDELLKTIVVDNILPTIKFGLKCPSEGIRKVTMKLLKSLLIATPKQKLELLPCHELINYIDSSNIDEDIFENLFHVQLHRRGRMLLKISKLDIQYSYTTLYEFIFPYIFNIICFRVKKTEQLLNENASTSFQELCLKLSDNAFLKMIEFLCGFLTSNKKQAKLDNKYKFDLTALSKVLTSNDYGQSTGVLLQSVNKRCVSLLCRVIDKYLVLLESKQEKALKLSTIIISLLNKSMIKQGNDKVGVRYKLSKVEIYVKILTTLHNSESLVYLNRLIKKVCQSLRHREFHIRDNARKTLVVIFKTYYSFNRVTIDNMFKTTIEDMRSVFKEGYQKHVLSYSISYLLENLQEVFKEQRKTFDKGSHLDESLFKIVPVLLNEIIGNVSNEKEAEYQTKLKSFHELNKSKANNSFLLLGKLLSFDRTSLVFDKFYVELNKSTSVKVLNKLKTAIEAFIKGTLINSEVERESLLQFINELKRNYIKDESKSITSKKRNKELVNWNTKDFEYQVLNKDKTNLKQTGYNLHKVEKVPQLTGYNRYSNVMMRAKMSKTVVRHLRYEVLLTFVEKYLSEEDGTLEAQELLQFVVEQLNEIEDTKAIQVSYRIISRVHDLSDERKRRVFTLCLQHINKFGIEISSKNEAILRPIHKCLKRTIQVSCLSLNDLEIILTIIEMNIKKAAIVLLDILILFVNKTVKHDILFSIMKQITNEIYYVDSNKIRTKLHYILLQYFIKYDNITMLLNKILNNLAYELAKGRISGLDMLFMIFKNKIVFTKICEDKKLCLFVFLSLALRLNNETNINVQEKLEKTLQTYFKQVENEYSHLLQEIYDLISVWFRNNGNTKEQLLLKLLGIRILAIVSKEVTSFRTSSKKCLSLVEALINLFHTSYDDSQTELTLESIKSLTALTSREPGIGKLLFKRLENPSNCISNLFKHENFEISKGALQFVANNFKTKVIKTNLNVKEVIYLFSRDEVDKHYLKAIGMIIQQMFQEKDEEVCLLSMKQFSYLVKRHETQQQKETREVRLGVIFEIIDFFIENSHSKLISNKAYVMALLEPFVYFRDVQKTDKFDYLFQKLESKIETNLMIEAYTEISNIKKEKKLKRKTIETQMKLLKPKKYSKIQN